VDLSFVVRLLPGPFYKVPRETDRRRDGRVRHIVQRNAEGNVRLGLGKYITKRDLEKSYDNIRNVNFSA